jgi:hypothetical protein
MTFKFRIFFIFIICLIYSCDRFYSIEVANTSTNNYSISIEFDREALKNQTAENRSYITQNSDYWNKILIKFDSINLISEYKLLPKDTFRIEDGRTGSEKFKYIKRIKIFAEDTIVLNGKKELEEAFRNFRDNEFIISIK